jgi:uncharacterized membrane protein
MCAILKTPVNFHFTTPQANSAASNSSMTIAYDVLTAAVAGIMAGNEFAVAAFVHPQLRRLSDSTHAQTAVPLAAVLGKAMPFWYGVAFVLILGAAFEHRPVSSGPGMLIASAGLLWAITIVFTVTMLVPINNRIARMNPEQPYPTWQQDRCRWDRLHRVRVELLIIAVLLLLTGLLSGSRVPVS